METDTSDAFTFLREILEEYGANQNIQINNFKKKEEIPQNLLGPEWFSILKEGVIVLFWEQSDNKKIIFDFKSRGQSLMPVSRYDRQTFGKLHAKILKDAEIIFIKSNFLRDASLANQRKSDFFHSIISEEIRSNYKKIRLLKGNDLKSRYEIFFEQYHDMYNEISDRMIANFLGVHHTSLSRVKTQMLHL